MASRRWILGRHGRREALGLFSKTGNAASSVRQTPDVDSTHQARDEARSATGDAAGR